MVKVYTLEEVKKELIKIGLEADALEGMKPIAIIGLWQERR